MTDLKQLKRLLKQDNTALPSVKVALLGDSATQLLATAIRGTGVLRGLNIDLFEAEYNQVEMQLLDPASELYAFDSEYVVLFQSSHKLVEHHSMLDTAAQETLADERLAFVEAVCSNPRIVGRKVVCFNYPEIDDAVFGSYADKVPSSFTWQVRKLNYGLMTLAQRMPNLYVCDVAALQNKVGRDMMFAPNVYTSTEMVLSVDVVPAVASRVLDIICAIRGSIKKCLIVDLDNTLWGGVVGDDGWEALQLGHGLGIGKAYTEFQMWVKKLRQRGVIICVCSKNDDAKAREPFEKHPDMVLRMDDIAVFMANWETKVDNIKAIQKVLNIGFDSMVFVDDNPFERAMVRENIGGIEVPEMPEDPAEWLEYMYGLNLFETASYSGADAERTRQYQAEAQRVTLAKSFDSEADFLRSLAMKATVSGFTPFNAPRVAQLSQRSNQFNLRTVRYTEADVAALAADGQTVCLALTLEDRFGDNGLVAVVVMKPIDTESLFVETWLMSCRVLKRGMEDFTLNTMVTDAKEHGYKRIVGEYLPTAKNGMVADHYKKLGFAEVKDVGTAQWVLETDGYIPHECCIEKKA
jgi:FkbH-like protein